MDIAGLNHLAQTRTIEKTQGLRVDSSLLPNPLLNSKAAPENIPVETSYLTVLSIPSSSRVVSSSQETP